MITIFTIPKPFRGHIGKIQRNAIGSWVDLHPDCEVILFGDEEGTSQVAKEFGIRHEPNVKQNEYGTPLLNDMFERAAKIARHGTLTFVNGDIILMNDFIRAVERIGSHRDKFLMVGECWDVKVEDPLQFGAADWQLCLRELVCQKGASRGLWFIDYFVFPKGLYQNVPPFAIGRAGFDNWLIWQARNLGASVIDATRVVSAIHQNHDYAHVPGGRDWSYRGDEAKRNLNLAGGREHFFTIVDATHNLHQSGLKRNLGGVFRLKFRWYEFSVRFKERMTPVMWRVVEWTRPARHALGVRKATWVRLGALVGRRGTFLRED